MPFTCKIEVDKGEFVDIIGVMEKGFSAQPNALSKIEIGYNGKELYVKTSDDPVDFTKSSPLGMLRLTSLTASTPSKDLLTFSMRT